MITTASVEIVDSVPVIHTHTFTEQTQAVVRVMTEFAQEKLNRAGARFGGKRSLVLLGGGFSDNEYPELDQFLLETSNAERPRVCFIPAQAATPVATSTLLPENVQIQLQSLAPRTLPSRVRNLDTYFSHMDVIYVGGGNTANLLEIGRLHALDTVIRKAYNRGTILAGVSAGAACWFEACLTDSFGVLAPLNDGLGLIPGSFCPHYHSEKGRAATF